MNEKEIKIIARLSNYEGIVYDIYLGNKEILFGYRDIISALSDLKLSKEDFNCIDEEKGNE